jgi:hypothetical protein
MNISVVFILAITGLDISSCQVLIKSCHTIYLTTYIRIRHFFNSGGRIRTSDLRVMGPTSYQTALPRGHSILYHIHNFLSRITK